MPRDDKSQDVVVNGQVFKRVKMGLDEAEVLPFIQRIMEERDEMAKHRITRRPSRVSSRKSPRRRTSGLSRPKKRPENRLLFKPQTY